MANGKLKLVLCWHMHQPHYRDGQNGIYRLPWVYLHALKDYTDMVWHLENCPQAKVVVNFAPVLVEQLQDYADQLNQWLKNGKGLTDELLNRLVGNTPVPTDLEGRKHWLELCQKAHAPTVIHPIEPFRKMLDAVNHCAEKETSIHYLNEQYFTDLMVWYHLSWMGQSLRQQDKRLDAFFASEGHFTESDIRLLVEIIRDAIVDIVPRYRRLKEAGQIEISMTPYGHPIVPLMIDFESIKQSMPDALMPESSGYPDGENRARWHMNKGFELYDKHFGGKPRGIWLSEGAMSDAAVKLLDEFDIDWTASGEAVWRHSCECSMIDEHEMHSKRALYQSLQLEQSQCNLFFRDDGLSDLIGFVYKDWNPDDAVNNFAHHLDNIANFLGDSKDQHVVSVILDGENAWEYYPDNAMLFLSKLYERVSQMHNVEMSTYSNAIDSGVGIVPLCNLRAGSWVYGTFSTWMGDKDKNRGWDLLVAAKQAYDQLIQAGTLKGEQLAAATDQLAICEGSDWFWWFGDYNSSESVRDFDQLYRSHLRKLYELMELSIPENLNHPISFGGGGVENSGTMRRNA